MKNPAAIQLAIVLCTSIGLAPLHAADDYPSRPVTVVVPFTPGGSTDIMARYEAEVLQRALGQSFVVENKQDHSLTVRMAASQDTVSTLTVGCR